ncbi:hypothetical protein ARTSIC4J27_4493 [Pseudarthrobacter siccitolerans]|uniref:Uncharacterized protein n=1 Tax=Pseudarthrobacter siccitolerans TaxID=861266 RepID=A0A024H921_9MICC|nr:hypothetical protein ARTSIC4J27_4493 [Pseudarthrobacter siccitolerans]
MRRITQGWRVRGSVGDAPCCSVSHGRQRKRVPPGDLTSPAGAKTLFQDRL